MTFKPGEGGRPEGAKNKVTLQDIDARLSDIEQELALIRASLPRGCDPQDYISGRESAEKLLGKDAKP